MSKALIVFHLLTSLQSVANNLAHPVTPALINGLDLHDSMFGLAYAAMSLGVFLFSLFWGDLSSRVKKTTILMITLIGYAVGQTLFMIATTSEMILLGRFVAGMFTGGFQVAQLNYLVSQSPVEKRGMQLTLSSTLVIFSSTIGYLIGGLLGDVSITLAFQVQIILCIVVGVLYFVLLNHSEKVKERTVETKSSINPFRSFVNAKHLLTPLVSIMMVSILLSNLGSITFDQTFNYYIRDVFGFLPSSNGYLKVGIGLVGIIANLTITSKLIRRPDVNRSYSLVMILMSVVGFVSIIAGSLPMFLIASFIFLALDAMTKPLQQSIVSSLSDDYEQSHLMMGLYNAMRSMGMIGGGLVAGLLYSVIEIGPFLFASVMMLFAGLLMWVYYGKTKRVKV